VCVVSPDIHNYKKKNKKKKLGGRETVTYLRKYCIRASTKSSPLPFPCKLFLLSVSRIA